METEIHVPTVLSHSIAVGKYGHRPLNHAVLELEKEPEPAKKEKAQDLSSKLGPLVDEWVSEKKFCREGLTIKDVALEMGTNQNYNFSRWFRVVTDMTPFQYRRSQLSGK